MKSISQCRSAAVFAGFMWVAAMAGAGPDQAQTSTPPEAPPPAHTKVQASQNTPQKQPVKMGVWHHFGEGDTASVAGQNGPGARQQIGPNAGTTKVDPGGSVPRQTFITNRLGGLERQMWALVNRERLDPATSAETGGRAQPLRWNEKLAAVARAHSRDMIEQRYFDHVDPEGGTLVARINAAGIPWRAVGENIALNGTVPGAEAAFMNEPRFQKNHRGNILNAKYTDVGIGIVQGPNGSLYITQDFATIPTN